MEPFDGDLAIRLKAALEDDLLGFLVHQASTAQLNEDEQDRLERYTRVKIEGLQSLADTMDDPEDAEELYDSLVNMWIELRSEWSRYNKTVNYRRLIHDQEDRLSSALGAVVSSILRTIEPLIPNDLHRLTDFASAPVPSMTRSGRFANTNVDDRVTTADFLKPLISELSALIDTLNGEPSVATSPQWQDTLRGCVQRVVEVAFGPGVPTEVATAAVEERLLRLGEKNALPLAPRVKIAGTERLEAGNVARLIASMERLFDVLSGALQCSDGPVRSQAEFHVADQTIEALVSVLPSFFVDTESREAAMSELSAQGSQLTFDPTDGLSVRYQLERQS